MIDLVRDFIINNALIKKKDKILIALSGGMDSIVLFDLLFNLRKELQFTLFAAHFNHNIRPSSKDDAIFTRDFCKRKKIPFYLGEDNVPQFALDKKISIEVAARKLRHDFLRQAAAGINADKIALAHHKNDRAETYLMRVFRGSSGDGLGCMPAEDGKIIRPLLCVMRLDIKNYAVCNKLSWHEDETNSDIKYTRNNIRHKTMPHIKRQYNNNIISTLSNNAKLMNTDRKYFEEVVKNKIKKAKITDEGYYLSDDDFIYLHDAILSRCIRLTLFMLGAQTNIYENNIRDIMELFEYQKTGAMINLPNGFIARRDAFGVEIIRSNAAPEIFIEKKLDINGVTIVPDCGTFVCEDADVNFDKLKTNSKNIAFFDTMTVPDNLIIRTRRQGDIFYPLGAGGKKTLKEYFIDKKFSRFKRDFLPLIADDNEILWIVGHEISDKMKVTKDTIGCKKIIFNKERLDNGR